MLEQSIIDHYKADAQGLAEYFSSKYFKSHEKSFPINPFQVLSDLGITFVFRNLDGIEGLFFPGSADDPVDLVVINARRPITRQRYSAAHELCHFLKDRDSCICLPSGKTYLERYAEQFAAAFLMPRDELVSQISTRLDGKESLTLDDVLYIAEHFGVSFSACLNRIRILFGYLAPFSKKEIQKFKPDLRRAELGLSYLPLFEDLFDAWNYLENPLESDYARHVFKSNYIFNDARLEGVNTTKEATAEIVADLTEKKSLSQYSSEEYDAYCHVAGHSLMYDSVFELSRGEQISVYQLMRLNHHLFSCTPNPDYGGTTRTSNPLVLGAKFETVDCRDIFTELSKVEVDVKKLDADAQTLKRSEIIGTIARIHHRITVIHPFGDGNGRTSRAFMNLMLLRYNLPPFYIKVDIKNDYYAALEAADKNQDYSKLKEFIMKSLISAHVELTKWQ